MPIPRIGEPAPQFTSTSTCGDISLSDYRGRWVVLFSHPADFTPVCTSEFVAFAQATADFETLGVQLVGLSVDSVYAHVAWLRNIEDKFSVKVTFPVIADLGGAVAQRYGMIHSPTGNMNPVRALFVIDPNQELRAMMYYPASTGRSVAEVLRLVQALQLHAAEKLATPEAWRPGDACVLPAPTTLQGAEERLAADDPPVDWYYATTLV